MIALLMTFALGQDPCLDSAARIAVASQRASLFDLQGAAILLARDLSGCNETAVAYWYVRGVFAAREAYRYGGSPEWLEPVEVAIEQLAPRTAESRVAEIATLLLQAASSAAQSERDEMGLFLEHAADLEQQQRAAGLPGVPVISAHELAGELWLQVHRFEDARRAFLIAAQEGNTSRRVTLGRARTSSRLGDLPSSCEQYRTLVMGWPQSGGEPPELTEARTFLRRRECRAPSGQRSPR
jgi:hypothetical protein